MEEEVLIVVVLLLIPILFIQDLEELHLQTQEFLVYTEGVIKLLEEEVVLQQGQLLPELDQQLLEEIAALIVLEGTQILDLETLEVETDLVLIDLPLEVDLQQIDLQVEVHLEVLLLEVHPQDLEVVLQEVLHQERRVNI